MKVGIITILRVNNYGAELQAFALQRKLEILGFESEIINYLYYKNWRYQDTPESKPFVPMSTSKKVKYFLMYRIANFFLDEVLSIFYKPLSNRLNRFENFHKVNTKLSKEFKSFRKLYAEKHPYNAFIVGSDQVWNPSASASIEPFFLTFAPADSKKVAFASSFGVSEIEDFLAPKYKSLLNNIQYIGVREAQGVDLIKKITGRDVNKVLDPTFLLNKQEWNNFMVAYPKFSSSDYIVIYQLSESPAIIALAHHIAAVKNIPIYRICKRAINVEENPGIINILDAGPSEFLWLIKNASYVITNSFHGTAFSINLNTPFYTVLSKKKKNNSRLESVLSLFGLSNQLLYDNMEMTSVDVNRPIDFDSVNTKMEVERSASLNFLTNVLNK